VTRLCISGIKVDAKQQAACAAEQICIELVAWLSRAEQGRAGQGRAGQGRAGQGRAGQGRAGLPMLYMEKGIQFANLQHIDLQLQQGTLCPALL